VAGANRRNVRTFLITDVRGYTRFTVERGDEAAAALSGRLAAVAGEVVNASGGEVVELRGDEVMAVFLSPRDALRASVALQLRCADETVHDGSLPLRVGVGLDAGEAVPVTGGFRGLALNIAARLCALAGPGEILATETVARLAGVTEGITYVDRGLVKPKGLAEAIRVVAIYGAADGAPDAGATRSESPVQERLPVGGFLGALPDGPLIAREGQLADIERAISRAAAGAGELLLLAGEPGIGKTRLAQGAMVQLLDADFLVAVGRCYEAHQAVPYYPFLELLSKLTASCPDALRARIPLRWPALAALLPDLGLPQLPRLPPEEERERLFRAVTGFVTAVAGERPAALLIDDLQWADSSSLDLIHALARGTRAHRVILLLTARDAGVGPDHPLARVLHNLDREHLVERLPLPRFTPEETARFVAAALPRREDTASLAGMIHERAAGNAFFTREILRALTGPGSGLPAAVPESIRAAVEQRVGALPPDERDLLRDASILGQAFRFTDLQSLGRHDEGFAETAVGDAVTAGLIDDDARGGYIFTHALIQQSLYQSLAAARRRRLHAAAGRALLEPQRSALGFARPRPAAEPLRHFLAAGELEEALPLAILAGNEAEAVFAHAEAEEQYRLALRLAEEHGSGDGRGRMQAEIGAKLGAVLTILARYDEAMVVLETARTRYQALGNRDGEAHAVAQIGVVHHACGTAAEGAEYVERFLAGGTPPAAAAGAAVYHTLSFLLMLAGRMDAGIEAAQETERLARLAGDDHLLAEAAMLRGTALREAGHGEEAERVLEPMVPVAEATGDIGTLSLILDALADYDLERGALAQHRERRQRVLELFQQIGEPAKIAYGLSVLGISLFYLGDWPEACGRFQEARSIIAGLSSWVTAWPPIGLGMCALLTGDLDRARRLLEEGVAGGAPLSEPVRYGHIALAVCDLRDGHPDNAAARLEHLLDQAGWTGHNLLAPLAEAYVAMERHGKAREVLDDGIAKAAAEGIHLPRMEMMRVRGMVRARERDPQGAESDFRGALDLAREMGYPYAVARILADWGMVLHEGGDRESGEACLVEALDIFRRLGARWDEERIVARRG
jgi:class 3 adenylate cyclase/tetratricopeptide (TPR) repeat protein